MLAELQQKGSVRHIGLSNVTPCVAEARKIVRIVCVQNLRTRLRIEAMTALIDNLAKEGIAYVPFFPLGGFYSPSVDEPV